MRGKFVVFDGGNGCGKTSVVKAVTDHFTQKGVEFVQTREPGGTKAGESIRALILNQTDVPMDVMTQVMLFAAARAELVSAVIRPAMENMKHVLSDRYISSSIAFQGHGLGADIKKIERINELATDGLKPDLTIILDVDTDTAKQRVCARNGEVDRFELFDEAFNEKVRHGYLSQVKQQKHKMVVVDASQPLESVIAACISEIEALDIYFF